MVKTFLAFFLVLLMLLATGCTLQVEEDSSSSANQYNPTVGGWKTPPPKVPGEKEEGESLNDSIDDSKVPANEWTYLVKGGVAQFVVVAASAEYDALAKNLAQDLTARTSVPFQSVKSANKGTADQKKSNCFGRFFGKGA